MILYGPQSSFPRYINLSITLSRGHPLYPPPGDMLGSSVGWALGTVTRTQWILYYQYTTQYDRGCSGRDRMV